MRIALRWTPLAALLVAACIDIPDPRTDVPAGEDPSMQPGGENPPGEDPPSTEPPPGMSPWLPTPMPPVDPCLTSGTGCPGDAADAGAGSGADAGAEPGPEPEPEPEETACTVAGQSFPSGSEVPSGDDCNSCSCADGSVVCTDAECDPVFCAEFVEEPDAVCSRFPLDPCSFQDPDCGSEPPLMEP